jgi:tetratricopeptide (TPR) repeat protein
MTNLAILYGRIGHIEQAEQTHEQALVIHRELRNRRFEGVTMGNLAGLYTSTGRPSQAVALYEKALAIHREVGHRHFEGLLCCDYAECLLALGRESDAGELWRIGAEMLLQLNDICGLERKTKAMRVACAKLGVPPFDG